MPKNKKYRISGIYEIKNTLNNHRYIGSSVDIKNRWSFHKYCLKRDKHHSSYLQNAWNKYGKKHFEFNILEVCEPIKDTILAIEQKYLDLKPEYNILCTARGRYGFKVSDETIKVLREKNLGENNPRWGVKESQETRDKKSNAQNRFKKTVIAFDKVTLKKIAEFESLKSAARFLGDVNKKSAIVACIRGEGISAYGYIWKLK